MADVARSAGCICGAVQLSITGEPAAMAYCHCESCRSWLGAPVHAASLWPTPNVTVTKGEDRLGVYKRTELSHRHFCARCGAPVLIRHPAMGLIAVGFIFMAASSRGSRLCLLVRHPQLTGVAIWGIAHLMMNGNSRDLVLFGGLTVWAIAEMFTINRRDGEWIKGEAPSWASEIVTVVLALVVVAVVAFIHPWIAGMPIA